MTNAPPSATSASDREVLRRIAADRDEHALGQLYDRYGQALYALVYRIVGQKADAEEVLMEAFAQVWRDARRFDPTRGSVAAWLTTITRSRALDFVRARARRARITATAAREAPEGAPAMGTKRDDPSRSMEHAERTRRVAAALQDLSAPQREAIELAYFEGLSQSEIADRLKEPLGTVKTRVRLGMQKLRDTLRPYYFEPAS